MPLRARVSAGRACIVSASAVRNARRVQPRLQFCHQRSDCNFLTADEQHDLEAMMTLYRRGRIGKIAVLKFLESIECLKRPLIATRPMFLGCRSRSAVAPPIVGSPARALNTVAARSKGKGNSKGFRLCAATPRNLQEALE
eukprot:s4653_g2.t1